MKHLALIALFFSFNIYASTIYTHCQEINLSKDHQTLELYIAKNGSLAMDSKFELNALDNNGNTVVVKGLNVQVQKVTQVDTFTKNRSLFGVHSSTVTKVAAVKFHVIAEEPIASELQGCIPRKIKEFDEYVICKESVTVSDNE